MNKELFSKIRCAAVVILLILLWIVPSGIKYKQDYLTEPTEQTVATEIETEENIIRWKEEEVTIAPVQAETVTDTTEVQFYDVPLSEDLQLHLFAECEKHNIAPAIILAMIEQESSFNADAVGDGGKSLGLMQIQSKWNKGTMDKLGCNDLLDPYQNIMVGVDIISQLKDKNPDLYWVLMAYNGGEDYATRNIKSENYSDYAIDVVKRAGELEDAKE